MRQRMIAVVAVLVVGTPLFATTACNWGRSCGYDDCGRFNAYQDPSSCQCISRGGRPPPPPACSSDDDCADLEHCLPDKTCSKGCATDADCRRGASCGARATCRRACATKADCSVGFECTNGACEWVPSRCDYPGSTCPMGQVCESNVGPLCAAICGTIACRGGLECLTDPGATSPRCGAPDYRGCSTDADCNTELGGACVGGNCFGPRFPRPDAGTSDADASPNDADTDASDLDASDGG